VWLAVAALDVIRRATSISLARVGDVQVGWPALAFAAAVCAAITFVFGAVALLHVRRRDVLDGLRPHAGITPEPRAVFAQRLALVTQVALVIVLTVTGGLLLRSLTALLDVDPGFNPHGAMAIRVDPAGRLNGPDRLPFFTQVLERVGALPGVQSAALTIHVPMGDRPSMGWDAIQEGREYNPLTDNAAGRIVSPGYFRAAGISLLEGRDFGDSHYDVFGNWGRLGHVQSCVASAMRGMYPTPEQVLENYRNYADFMKDFLRTIIGNEVDQFSDAELNDVTYNNLFPNFAPWGGFMRLVYRWRPNGDNPDEAIMEVMLLVPWPEGKPKPSPAPVHELGPDDPWTSAPELGSFARILDQDCVNLPRVHRGLKTTREARRSRIGSWRYSGIG